MHLLDLRTTRYVSQYDMMIYKPLYTQFSTLTYTISSFLKTYISIYTLSTMDMYILNVDEGDLMRIHEPGFSATKRILDSEAKINKAIFHLKDAEMMASETFNKSSLVTGGAGTGKTELLIQKIAAEDPTKRVLVVSRLPDLVKKIRQDVEAKRSSECTSFMVYDDLMKELAKKVIPGEGMPKRNFISHNRVRFDCDESFGVSLSRQFVGGVMQSRKNGNITYRKNGEVSSTFAGGYLTPKERNQMSSQMIAPLTLWNAIITIKSHNKCAITKEPLTGWEYLRLPKSYGLTEKQRTLCYDLFTKYEQWRKENHFWDDSDRVMYVFVYGPSVFSENYHLSWLQRVYKFGEADYLLDEDGEPLFPFFWDLVCLDEAQDFTEFELTLFAKMSASLRSLFLCADPAQSVEVGVKMRGATVNDVMHSLSNEQVQSLLQYIKLQTNHRTHQQNLALSQAVRRILARSFKVPYTDEIALINGNMPKTMKINSLKDLGNKSIFCGETIVLLTPDEKVEELKLLCKELSMENEVKGVREAKGLEYPSVALVGFFQFIEEGGSAEPWTNALRWLSSSFSLTTTESSGEQVAGVRLADCDYTLSHPNVADEAMILYTALTRARERLYLIEVDSVQRKKHKQGLSDFAFRRLSELGLAKAVNAIDEGKAEMTAAEHKVRGMLNITQALQLSRGDALIGTVREQFAQAANRFKPDKGNDKDLLDKCDKHLEAYLKRQNIMRFMKLNFIVDGAYNLEGKFAQVLLFEEKISEFFSNFVGDSFLTEEVHYVRCVCEDLFEGSPYEKHFADILVTIKKLE